MPPGSECSICALNYKVEIKILGLLGHANNLGAMLIKANAASNRDWWQKENTTDGSWDVLSIHFQLVIDLEIVNQMCLSWHTD